jgi:hypothetical protein
MHTEEGAERGVDAGNFHRDQAEQLLASAGAAVAFVAQAAELQFLEGWQQLERERILGPVLVDDRLDLSLHVGANLPDDRPLIVGQDVHELVEVAVGRRELLRRLLCCCCDGRCCCHLASPFDPGMRRFLPTHEYRDARR